MDQVKREMAQIKQAAPPCAKSHLNCQPLYPSRKWSGNRCPTMTSKSCANWRKESYVYGNLVGLTDKTGLARDLVSSRLAVLKSLGVIETRMNERNVLHWFVSPKGKQMLGDVLSGQEEH